MKSIDSLLDADSEVTNFIPTVTLKSQMHSLWSLIKQSKTLYLTPYLFMQGVNMAFTFGVYPIFVSSFSSNITQNALNLSYGFLFYGIGSFIGSISWGKLYGWIGMINLMIIHVLIVCATLFLVIQVNQEPIFELFLLIGFLLV